MQSAHLAGVWLILMGGALAMPGCGTPKRDFGDGLADAGDSPAGAGDAGTNASGGNHPGSGGMPSSFGPSGMSTGGADAMAGMGGALDQTAGADGSGAGTGDVAGFGARAGASQGGANSGGAGSGGAASACSGSTEMACAGTCVNVQNSSTNCGTCGHDCSGGTCAGGQCQPLLVGRYDRYLGENGLSLGANDVYGKGETNLIVRARKDGSSYSASSYLATFGTSGCAGGGVAEINGRVFYQWNDGASCRMAVCSTSDCDGTTQGISPAGATSWVQSFGADTTNERVFWYDPASKRFLLASAPASGTPTPTTISSGDITNAPTWTGYSSGGILFSDTSTSLVTINRLPASGGSVQHVASGTGINLNALWASSSRLYFSDASTINYVALPTGSGGAKLIRSSAAQLLWSDDVELYWVDASDSTKLMTCALGNCASTTKTTFTSKCSISGLRGENNAIFWGTSGGACPDNMQLWKLAR
jgi:hypothetical protein